jgi:type II secretory pathway pseudopilin PulG
MLEMLAAVAISLTLAGITVMAFVPVMKQQRDTEAYNFTLGTLRHARDQAASDMRTYVVTFNQPATGSGTIVVQQVGPGITSCQIPPTGNVWLTTTLPWDIIFQVEPGAPTSNTTPPTTPDAFGTGLYAIDLDEANNPGTTSICFNPDGTATDANGNLSNGVVYMGRTGDVYSGRAITVWGATGRIRGWRLYNVSGTNTWSYQ